MKIKIIILFMFCVCSAKCNIDYAFHINKDKLHQKDTFALQIFGDLDKIEKTNLELFFDNESGNTFYNIQLDSSNNFTRYFFVPTNAEYLTISILTKLKEGKLLRDQCRYPIYLKDESPSPNSFAKLVFLGKTRHESDSLFYIDAKYFPNLINRYSYMWSKMQRAIKDTSIANRTIKNDLDSVAIYFDKAKSHLSIECRANFLAVTSYGYSIIDDKFRCLENLSEILNLLKNNNSNSDSLIFKDNLHEIIDNIYSNQKSKVEMQYKYKFNSLNDSISNQILCKLLEIAVQSNNSYLLFQLGRRTIAPEFIERNSKICNSYLQTLYQKVIYYYKNDFRDYDNGDYSFLTYNTNPISSLIGAYSNIKNYQRCDTIFHILIDYNNKFMKEIVSKNLTDVRSALKDKPNLQASIYRNLALNYRNLGDTNNYISFLKKSINEFPTDVNSIQTKASSCYDLFLYYYNNKDLKEMEDYVAKSYEYKSLTSDLAFRKLNHYRDSIQLPPIDKDSILAKFNIQLISFSSMPFLSFKSDKRTFSLSEMKDTTLFIFNIRDECPSCNLLLPSVLEKLIPYQDSGKCYLILVSDLNIETLKKVFGSRIHYTKRDNALKSLLKPISIDPMYHAIIKNSKYITDESLNTDIEFYKQYMN